MEKVPEIVPVLPIRNAVLFPSISMPLMIGRERSIKAIEAAEKSPNYAVVLAQRLITQDDPEPDDLYRIGTLCKIENVTKTESGGRQVVVTGLARFRARKIELGSEGFLAAHGETIEDRRGDDTAKRQALFLNLKEISREILELLPGTTEPIVRMVDNVSDPTYLSNVCAAYLNLPLARKQELLETIQVESRMEELLTHMRKERESLLLQNEIRDKMSERLNKAQRDALLREQLRTIRSELGDDSDTDDSDGLEERISEAGLSEEALKQAREELRRLRSLPSSSAEYHVIRTYLDWIVALPWNKVDETTIDIPRARAILDEDHWGLTSVKKRILQYLAVTQLKLEATMKAADDVARATDGAGAKGDSLRGPILCLIGPPGVGKTSLGKSIARALGRQFVRASLGGVRDEAEIRGHRRTYVGAMPGRILQSLKRAGTRDPVMILDEIDKLRADFQGDPSSAMLEVLDPEQNHAFSDHYLDLPFDLSSVFFVATANVADTIPAPLRDRMEIIEVSGYTLHEKLVIAQRHLIPKLLRESGLKPQWIELPEETIRAVISLYTREAGVRELQRRLAALLRAAAEEILERRAPGTPHPVAQLGPERLRAILGAEAYATGLLEVEPGPGVVTGLAWTPHGGDILHVEASFLPGGKGSLTLTGQLGDVMKESAQIALSLARTASRRFFIKSPDFAAMDLHIHVPAGSIPKDGPSAGVTILTALASLLANKPVRSDIAMTGEITLRGSILPVGGIKEKVIAAHRVGIRTILLPRRNVQDLEEVPESVRATMTFVPVEQIEELLTHALGMNPRAAWVA